REESGPSTRMRLGPNSAYARSGTIVAYRPKMPGTPDATAYAIPTGTSIVVSTRPAITSFGSQAASYRLSTCNPGSQRFKAFTACPSEVLLDVLVRIVRFPVATALLPLRQFHLFLRQFLV